MTLSNQWIAEAPANIALIKYMGKIDAKVNIPANPSLSYTLDQFRSIVKIELNTVKQNDEWFSLPNPYAIRLSIAAQQRFLNHLKYLKVLFGNDTPLCIYSGNTFPTSCGIASSAASFAALTQAACQALSALSNKPMPDKQTMAQLSRQASGSSCRSFYPGWVVWEKDTITDINHVLPQKNLIHRVIIVDQETKAVSSSQAHNEVKSSLLYVDRPNRARARFDQLINALQQTEWEKAYHICWQEFQDMQALFETAAIPFGYITDKTLQVLNHLRRLWQTQHDGPLVTLDAGPNVHCLFRSDQIKMVQELDQFFTVECGFSILVGKK